MAEDLPDEFDVVVIGTGMPESILAAAFSRIGQSVLHIDRNAYYSGQWASFSLKAIEEWIEASQTLEETKTPDINVEGEQVLLHLTDKSYSQQKLQFHISDPEPEAEEKNDKDGDTLEGLHGVVTDSDEKENSGKDQEPGNEDEVGETESENKDKNETGVVSSVPKDGEHVKETSESNVNKDKCERNDSTEEDPEESSPNTNNISSGKSETSVEKEQPTLWTESRLRKDWRKFNLDLSPKLLYCGGSMVELLIISDIAKYCEFKTVSRILTLIDGKLRRVPCSRADVFSSKDVSMIEKRMMMKFLTFCVDFEKHEEDYKEFAEKPYKDFLEHQKLSKNVIHFIQDAISMTSDLTPTAEGLKKTQKFLHSLGRYGNTAFLWPLYGSGEMPQSFCRMCAVFGGVYCLRTPPASLVISPDNVCTGVIMATGKHIKCKRIVMENSYAPEAYIDSVSNRLVCRGILVTDRSILSTEDAHQLSLLRLPDDSDTEHPTTLLELPATSMVCPTGLYVIHLTKEVDSDTQSPEEVLQPAVNKVFQATDAEIPKVLWSLYYQQKINNGGQSKSTPTNVILVPGPGPEIDIDHSVTIARKIFEEIMPGEDFLPRPPNPEDIIFVDEEETQVTQDSEKTEFNETSQDSEEKNIQTADIENDQSNESTEPKTTDVLCENDLTPDSSNNSKVAEISESVETCRMEEK